MVLRSSSWVVLLALGAIIGALTTLGVSALTRSGEIEVRINAIRDPNGDVRFALQQRQPDLNWGTREEPRANVLPASRVGRWAYSSPLEVTWEVEIEPEETVVAVVTQIEEIDGVEVAVDRYMEVETVPHAAQFSGMGSADEDSMEDGGPEGIYSAFCTNSLYYSSYLGVSHPGVREFISALWQSRNREITAAEWLRLLDLELTIWVETPAPPPYALFHNAMVSGLTSVRDAVAQLDQKSVVKQTDPKPQPFLDHARRVEWTSQFPAEVISLLKHEGCFQPSGLNERMMSDEK